MLKPTKILIPTDFSEYSNKALHQAFDIAKQYKAKVYVLHVVHGESYYEDVEKQMIEGARKKLQEEIDKFPQAKELEVFTEVVSGNTSEAILTEERSKGIDLIVILDRQCCPECPERGKVSGATDKMKKGTINSLGSIN
jgi:universal stress protein A